MLKKNDYIQIKCVFQNLFVNCFVEKNITVKHNKHIKVKWISRGIKTASKMKRFLNSMCKQTSHHTLVTYRTKYIKILKKVIATAKKMAVDKEVAAAKNSTKQIWNIINKHRNKNTNGNNDNYLIKINGDIIDNSQEIADLFAKQFDFSSVDPNISKKHDMALKYMYNYSNKVNTDITMRETNRNEIKAIVKRMETKKSYGFDEIPIVVIKDNIDLLAEPLANLFNECMRQGIFPDQLKIARVLPIYKKGSKTDLKNFRPISLLPIFSKIFEILIKDRIVTHLNLNKVLNNRQFGYQSGVGTNDAVELLINEVVGNLDGKMKVAGLFLDLSSAFDTVDHNILIAKLEYYGIRGNSLCLIKSYLNDRKQFVEIKKIENNMQVVTKSKVMQVERGVPQGSILGPIFFVVFLNDLINYIDNIVPDIKLVVYADDTNAIIPGTSASDLENRMSLALDAFHNWFDANNLKLNISKTQAILFKPTANKHEDLTVVRNGVNIDFASHVKFLGINIDEFLNWKPELDSLESIISSACYALRSLRDEVNIKQLKSVYYALVESKFRYSIRFWGNSYRYNLNRAFVLQKRAIRTIARIPPWESCKEHFRRLNVLTLPSLYILVVLMDIVRHPRRYESPEDRLSRMGSRRKDLALPTRPRLNVSKHACRYQAVKLFNVLPTELKTIENPNVFKFKLKKILLEKCLYSVEEFSIVT